ncbi:MAG TPA: hypothetical protein VNK51_15755 [Bradyrhizobium sp.]|nr:hypothetical protein [Bradyrhizobium sp.]
MSEKNDANFIDLCLSGNALIEEVDDFVDRWHESPEKRTLRDFLGMSDAEYSLWINDPDVLPFVIISRRERRPFVKVVNDNYYSNARLAARSDQGVKVRLLKEWLDRHGYLE